MKQVISKSGTVLSVIENIKSWTVKYTPVRKEDKGIVMTVSCNILKKDFPDFESLEKYIKDAVIFNISNS